MPIHLENQRLDCISCQRFLKETFYLKKQISIPKIIILHITLNSSSYIIQSLNQFQLEKQKPIKGICCETFNPWMSTI